jgi:uncharacterized protein YecE (DUF72 family)
LRDERQPGLFDDDPDPDPPAKARARARRGTSVGAAEPTEELRRIAQSLPAHVRLGTSSWSFPGWAGIVYDREASTALLARRGLAAYGRHPLLRAVGLDRTYYAPIPAASFAEYAAVVPDDFRFLVKGAAECTSPTLRGDGPERPNPRFLDSSWARDEVVSPFVEGLGSKAGPLVFQFPPLGVEVTREPRRFAESLARFLGALPAGPWYAVELREALLFGEPYLEALDASGAGHCFSRHPRMPDLDVQLGVAGAERLRGPIVVRWMLNPRLSYEQARTTYAPFSSLVDEDRPTRESLARLCLDPDLGIRPIVIVANNKAEGSAPLTVLELARAIAVPRG